MPENLPQAFSALMQLGQKLEGEGNIADALAAYDRAIELLLNHPEARDIADRRALALAWMNRGNALQKLAQLSPPVRRDERPPVDASSAAVSTRPEGSPATAEIREAYDQAIRLFESLPHGTHPHFRNHLGAAWLNRGHAFLIANENDEATRSFEQAVMLLQTLPLDADPNFRLNFAGALANLAHSALAHAPDHAAQAARAAIGVVRGADRAHELFAAMSLRARRAFVMAIGELLHRGMKLPVAADVTATTPGSTNAPDASSKPSRLATSTELVHEATDAIEEGLALARDMIAQGAAPLLPLAARLFRLGTQMYRAHQPQFLGEFVVETLDFPAFASEPDMRAAGESALTETLDELQAPKLFIAGTVEANERLALAESLRAARAQLRDRASDAPSNANATSAAPGPVSRLT